MIKHSTSTLGQAGFTLIEMVLALGLMGMMAGLGSSMIADVFRTTLSVNAGDAGVAQARYAIERVARELREVKYDGTNYLIASPSPLAPSASSITFTRAINGADVNVTIARSGSNLNITYSDTNTTSVLASGVTAFSVDFLAVSDAAAVGATTSNAAVKAVVVTLSTTDPTSGRVASQRTRVALRNA
jgi:prepilin-type N-terminal cleavage/methylation domain-containing protein